MEDDARLGPRARSLLANPAHFTIATLVSIWEITMKWRVGKHPLPGASYAHFVEQEGIPLLHILPQHIAAVEDIELHHKDLFDHLIIAQAKVEGATIITGDREIAAYGVPCIDCR